MVTSGRPARANRRGIDPKGHSQPLVCCTRHRAVIEDRDLAEHVRMPALVVDGVAERAGGAGRRAASSARRPTSRCVRAADPDGGASPRSATPSGASAAAMRASTFGLLCARERLEDEVHEQRGVEARRLRAGRSRRSPLTKRALPERFACARQAARVAERRCAHVDAGHVVAERRERHRVEARAAAGVEDSGRRGREQPPQAANVPGDDRSAAGSRRRATGRGARGAGGARTRGRPQSSSAAGSNGTGQGGIDVGRSVRRMFAAA